MTGLPSRNTSPFAQAGPARHLAGSANAEIPGWQERVKEKVAQSQSQRRRPSFAVNIDRGLRVLLREAAQRRQMSSAAYVRRAMCAFIAADLGLDWEYVTGFCPRVSDAGTGNDHVVGSKAPDDGVGYGNWDTCLGGCDD